MKYSFLFLLASILLVMAGTPLLAMAQNITEHKLAENKTIIYDHVTNVIHNNIIHNIERNITIGPGSTVVSTSSSNHTLVNNHTALATTRPHNPVPAPKLGFHVPNKQIAATVVEEANPEFGGHTPNSGNVGHTPVPVVNKNISAASYDKLKFCNPDQRMPISNVGWYKTYLTDFRCGHVTQFENGTVLRQFTLIMNDNHGNGTLIPITKSSNVSDIVWFPAWTFNNTLPGPTLRMTQGDHVQIKVINANTSRLMHSFHMHSIHSGMADGMTGPAGAIRPGSFFVFDFVAAPFGVYPYHCHQSPVEDHIGRGLFGMMIIDPEKPRPHMLEMVMMLNGYSFNRAFNGSLSNVVQDPVGQAIKPPTADMLRNNFTNATASDEVDLGDNSFYTVNGMAFAYVGNTAIELVEHQNYRIYLVNMLEIDPANNFHMHGNMFDYYPSGTSTSPAMVNDIITLSQGDRGIIEFAYDLPGDFMFHSHINKFSDLGWLGFFHVVKK